METAIKAILAAACLILSIVSGYWLRSGGRPHNPLLFNLHKFSSLAFVIITIWIFHTIDHPPGTRPVNLILILLAGISCILLFISGGLMSLKKQAAAVVRIIHRVSMVSTIGALTLLMLLIIKS